MPRWGQWSLDEAAFEVGGGRYGDEQKRELAEALDELSAAPRDEESGAVWGRRHA